MSDDRRTPPPTAEGWFALHDFRTVDWDAWRDAGDGEREDAIAEGVEYLETAAAVEDAAEGATAAYAVVGHKADLMMVHLRPALADLDAVERRFEGTALAGFTDQPYSYVSVTEASGYSERARGVIEGDAEEDSGLARYVRSRLYPEVPEAGNVCFYPMDKRRGAEANWYDLPFDERAEHMDAHGDIGRGYTGEVTQMITGSIGLDDWEWGVTLWADDPVQFKKLLYEMRFDPSSSRFAEFGPFYVGQRLQPGDLGALLAGERVPTGDAVEAATAAAGGPPATAGAGAEGKHARGEQTGSDHAGGQHTGDSDAPAATAGDDGIRGELADLGVYAGSPHGEDVQALVLYSEADEAELADEVDGLRANFDHYDTHVKTAVYAPTEGDGEPAVVSLWETASAADTAAGFLADLPGVVRRAGEGDGWGTMGMFYRVKADHREAFVETFGEVTDLLAGMDGHRGTALLANREDETDMFIDSRWDSREDAMAFFRGEAFADAVEWGRDVLDGRPRHVFLA